MLKIIIGVSNTVWSIFICYTNILACTHDHNSEDSAERSPVTKPFVCDQTYHSWQNPSSVTNFTYDQTLHLWPNRSPVIKKKVHPYLQIITNRPYFVNFKINTTQNGNHWLSCLPQKSYLRIDCWFFSFHWGMNDKSDVHIVWRAYMRKRHLNWSESARINLPTVKAEWLFNSELPSLKESDMSKYRLFKLFSFLFWHRRFYAFVIFE